MCVCDTAFPSVKRQVIFFFGLPLSAVPAGNLGATSLQGSRMSGSRVMPNRVMLRQLLPGMLELRMTGMVPACVSPPPHREFNPSLLEIALDTAQRPAELRGADSTGHAWALLLCGSPL